MSRLRHFNRLQRSGPAGHYRRAERWALVRFTLLALVIFLVLVFGTWGAVLGLLSLLVHQGDRLSAWSLVPLLALLVLFLLLARRLTERLVLFRRPTHDEVWLRREQAPELFAALEQMQARFQGPPIRGVAINRDMNAYAVWRRWFDLWFMPRRHGYISLGLPMLATLSAEEALAVVAHEYGHLAGYPHRWGALFHNLRVALLELQEEARDWSDRLSAWLARAVHRFVAHYDRLAFLYCRENEYGADALSVQVVSPEVAVWSLVRFQLARQYLDECFWPEIYARVEDSPRVQGQPYRQLAELARQPCAPADPDQCMRLMRQQLQGEADERDTHPSLAERIQALGFSPEAMLRDGISITHRAPETALSQWFSADFQGCLLSLDAAWESDVASWWQEQHQYRQEARREAEARRARKEALAARAELDAGEAWDLLLMRIDDGELEDADGAVDAYLRRHPAHSPAHYAAGRRWLGEDDRRALRHLHRALDLNPGLMPKIRKTLVEFYQDTDPERAQLYQVMFNRGFAPSSTDKTRHD